MRLVYILFAWVGGMLLADSFTVFSTSIWLGMTILALITLLLVIRNQRFRLVFVVILAFALGGLRYSFVPQTSDIARYNDGDGLTITGEIIDPPDIRDDRTQFRVAVDSVVRGGTVEASNGLVLVRAPRFVEVSYGDRISATGRLTTPAEYDLFSYADYLAQQGVFSILRDTTVTVNSSGHGNLITARLYDLRQSVIDKISLHLPEPQASLLTGILTGNERGISPELDADFQAVGASHIIAISGFNMVIIAGVVMRLFSRLNLSPRWSTALGLLVIALYTVFVGANPAVVRAAVMSGLLYVGILLRRKTYVPASLAFVALVMSFLDPNVLWSISFQLSFFAVLGLTLFAEPFQTYFDHLLRSVLPQPAVETISRYLFDPLIVTLAALVFTLPLSVIYFGRLSLLVVVVNVLIVPAQSYLLIIGGLATFAVFVVPSVGQLLYWIDMVLLSWTIGVVRTFAALPFADVALFIRSEWIVGYFSVLIFGAMMQASRPGWWQRVLRFTRQRSVVSSLVIAGVAISVLMVTLARSRPDGNLHVWFLDVGHSNAILLQSPGGAHILVDGGRFPSRLLTAIGDRLPFNDREIEVLFITQPDQFDIAALTAVLRRYEVGVAVTNGQPNLGDVYNEIQTLLADDTVVQATAGYTLEFDDGTLIEVLHPQRTPRITDTINDNVLVLRVTHGEISFLLTSDLGMEGQIDLLESDQWPLATVMQLPQHGTRRSLDEDFLSATQPQAIIIQADAANTRGDPDPDVLAMLPDGIPIYRTDEGGGIHIWTDGNQLWAVQND